MTGPASDGDLARGAALPEPPGRERLQALKRLQARLAGALAKTATATKFVGWAALAVYLAVYGWHVSADWLKTGGLPTLDITELSKGDSGGTQAVGPAVAPCPLGGRSAGGPVDTLYGTAFCSLEDLMVAGFPGFWGSVEAMAHAEPGSGTNDKPTKAAEQLADLQMQLSKIDKLIANPPPALAHPLPDNPPAANMPGLLESYLERLKGSMEAARGTAKSHPTILEEFKDVETQLTEIDKLIDDPPDLTPEEAGAVSAEEAGTRIARYLAKLKGPSSQALESVSSIRQALAEPAPEPSTPGAQMLITAAANLPLSLLLVMIAAGLERRFAKA